MYLVGPAVGTTMMKLVLTFKILSQHTCVRKRWAEEGRRHIKHTPTERIKVLENMANSRLLQSSGITNIYINLTPNSVGQVSIVPAYHHQLSMYSLLFIIPIMPTVITKQSHNSRAGVLVQ